MDRRTTLLALFGLVLLVIALACSPGPAGASEQGPGQPSPYCTWVDPVTEQVWVPPTTEVVIVVDEEAWTEHVPAVTHEECTPIKACPSYTWGIQYYWEKVGKHWELRSFGPITFTYDKSNDPNKCHRPTGESLGVPPALMNDFNHDFKEWRDAVCVGEECVTVVDQEAYDIFHPAITHEETVVVEEGYWKTVTIEEGYWDCPDMCQYNPDIPADDPKCKPPEVCAWDETDFALYALEGPDGQQATMYAYRLPDGSFPKGIATFRQECVLGWVAVNMSKAGVVERNTCTGEYRWLGMRFFPRQDVIEDGVCNRDGACIK